MARRKQQRMLPNPSSRYPIHPAGAFPTVPPAHTARLIGGIACGRHAQSCRSVSPLPAFAWRAAGSLLCEKHMTGLPCGLLPSSSHCRTVPHLPYRYLSACHPAPARPAVTLVRGDDTLAPKTCPTRYRLSVFHPRASRLGNPTSLPAVSPRVHSRAHAQLRTPPALLIGHPSCSPNHLASRPYCEPPLHCAT